MTPDEKTLIDLAQMIADREIAEVAKRVEETRFFANKIAELRSVNMLAPQDASPQMQVMGQAWGEWRRREIASLNLNLAKATLFEDAAKNKARRALGRRIALEDIFGKQG
ncbi:hypothetical protein [Donghicola mangrovi]|uniref:Uncharacterized protein n=1 Tax=Donghicola mangrovi TaxID=2729614 RepID=A0A850Q5V1_9RHOB|nr:hypothetical protein [Donghicola mangrovi]NVO22438.1 hypothetical protein [Donghicola mangrovi]